MRGAIVFQKILRHKFYLPHHNRQIVRSTRFTLDSVLIENIKAASVRFEIIRTIRGVAGADAGWVCGRIRILAGRVPATGRAAPCPGPKEIRDIYPIQPKHPKVGQETAGGDEAGYDQIRVGNQRPAQQVLRPLAWRFVHDVPLARLVGKRDCRRQLSA